MADNNHLSFSGKIWNFIEYDYKEILFHCKKTNLSELNIKILMNRGLKTFEKINKFLTANLKNTIPEPYILLDMEKAIERIVLMLKSNEKVLIFGDYDVDGVSSTFLLVKYFEKIGHKVEYYLPDRCKDGYGVSEKIIDKAVANDIDLIIIVDSGTNAVSVVQKANKLGIDIVILDHHLQNIKTLPPAIAIVNPNRLDQEEVGDSFIKNLCAAGVVFLFLIALQRKLKSINFFLTHSMQNLHEFISIVALATLCDVMEIKGMNRALVKYCLQNPQYPVGLRAILDVMKIEQIKSAEDFSYFVGPLINAAGRIANPSLPLKILLDENYITAFESASQLLNLNKKRKNIEKTMLIEAMEIIEKFELAEKNIICVFSDNWHEGVIGIIASKLKDKFQKPAFVISFGQNGIGKGSARSILDVNLTPIWMLALEQQLILTGGGHAQAGGFSIEKQQINNFYEFLNSAINSSIVNCLNIDSQCSINSNIKEITKNMSILEPFGKGMEKPIFIIKRVRIKFMKKTAAHIMLFFVGEFSGSMRGIIFNIASKIEFLHAIEKHKNELLDVAAFVSYDEKYGGSLILEDIRKSNIDI